MAATTFRVYADLKDGRGVVRAYQKEYVERAQAENARDRLLKGKTHSPRAYVVPFREGERVQCIG